DYTKQTLTWWDGDHTLMDESEEIVDDVEKLIGTENIGKFGESDPADPNVVYIRNDNLEIDFEVLREMGKYSVNVAGFTDDEPTHEPMRRPRPRLREHE